MSKRAIIFGGLGLAAVAALALFLLEPDPQTVLRKAQRALAAEKTMRIDVAAALALPPQELGGAIVPSATSVDIVMRVDMDRSDPLKTASVTTFAFTQGTGEKQRKLSGEARRKDGRHYLKLEDVGDLSPDAAGRLKGKWVVSDRPYLGFIVPPDERSLAERPLDAAGVAAMAQAFAGVDLFTVTGKKPAEKIGDAMARHYAVEVNMETVSALLLKLREARTGTPIVAEDVMAVTAEIVRWGKPVGEVWIDKRTGKFLKLGLISAVQDGESSGAVGGTVTFSRYGQPVAVDVPQAEDLESVLGPVFSKRLSLAGGRAQTTPETAPSKEQEPVKPAPGAAVQDADSDADGLSDGQENFYGSDAWSPDTDGDGWTDGLEVEKGMNPTGPGALFGFGL
ncbi:MAG TPA: hypothetical protein VJ694_02520 [Patescibacteria group bacterium]|nr:hypothetical protein [Patescibacteria group bacterium]